MNEQARALIDRAQALMASDPEAALAALDEAVEHAPDAAEIYLLRGDVYRVKEQTALAADEYSYAVEIDADLDRAWLALGECEAARGQWEAAAEAMTEAVELCPDEAMRWHSLGEAWLAANEYGRAIGAFESGLEADPDRAELYAGRARATLAMGLLDDAEEDIVKLIETSSGSQGFLLAAQLRLMQGRPEEAIASLDRLLATSPEHVEAIRLRGDACWEIGNAAAAEEAYRLSLTHEPGDVDTRLAIAECRLANDDPSGAIEVVTEVLTEVGDRDSSALELLARAQVAAGQPQEAIKTIARGLAAEGDPAPLYYRRATIHLAADRKNLAWRDARWAIDSDGDYAEAYTLRGRLALEIEGAEEAAADLDAALAIDPELGAAWAWRGRARELGGDLEEADADWAEAEALLSEDDPLRVQVTEWRRQSG